MPSKVYLMYLARNLFSNSIYSKLGNLIFSYQNLKGTRYSE